jgi:hypothetical protein
MNCDSKFSCFAAINSQRKKRFIGGNMRKIFVLFAMVLALAFSAELSFAGKICLRDNFGEFWELKGGKVDKKSYTLKIIGTSGCVVSGIADVTLTNSGSLVLSANNGHDTGAFCQPVIWSALVDSTFAGSGNYDQLGDGSISGTFSLTPVSCSSLPTTIDARKTMDSNSPLSKKQ